jgi:hypothetical protein
MNIGLSLGSAAVSALLGRQIMTQAISDASYSIYSSIGEVFYYTTSVDKVLSELDIGNKIKTMELLCKDLTAVTKSQGEKVHSRETAINFCLDNLHDMIIRIREDLRQISSIIKNHKDKYFTNWRSVDVKQQLYNLKLHSKLLDDRYDLFIKTLSVTGVIKK